MGCEAQSWSPEVISLFGDAETVGGKLSSYDMDLPNRRIYISVTETRSGADIAFFEKTDPKTTRIARWHGKTVGDLHERVSRAIVDNKGVYCVGEQTRAILGTLGEPDRTEEAPIPANAKAAFSHQIRAVTDDYVRSTFYLMC